MTESRARDPLLFYAIGGFVVLAAVALWRNTPHLTPGAFNWAESGNTAAALAEGRGFSDPFVGGTGPTAWIPPVFVWVVCGVFLVAGIKTAAAAAILVGLTVAALTAAHALLIACVPRDAPWMRRVTSAAFLVFATLVPLNPFDVLSEAWLNILLTVLLLWAALEHRRAPRRTVVVVLVVTAALAPLTNAGLALATGGVLLVLFALDLSPNRPRRAWLGVVLAAAATALAVGGWTARNAAALGRAVPLKSNFWFEVHIANVAADDGLPRTETALTHLPFFSTVEFNRYATLGELGYVATFREPSLAALRARPAHFAANVGRRFVNAFVFLRLAEGAMSTTMSFKPGDFNRLVQAGELLPLGAPNAVSWMRMDTPADAERATLTALHLDDFPHVWRDWMEKHADYDARHWGLRGLLASFLIAGAPVLAWLGAALAGRGRLPPVAGWAAFILVAMLLPFVLVNHSVRHQQPLIALQAVAFGACAEALVRRSREARRPAR